MTPEDAGMKYEDIYFTTDDEVELHGWYIPSDSSRKTVLFCHGNAGNISHRLEMVKVFNDLKLSVFIFDYRGYGQSKGSPKEKGTYLDAEAAWLYLTEDKKVSSEKIVIFGKSLGGPIAADLASGNPAGGLIIESSFTSAKDLGAEIYPFLPVRLLSRFEYNALEKIKKVDCPKLIIHSRDDELVPFSHGKKLYEAASEPREFLEISGSHNEGFWISMDRYKSGIESFIEKISIVRK